jgi:transcriptional antiterminator RfaH
MSTAWYALRTKPHKEQIVRHQVQDLGLEAFYPRVQANPVNPRAQKTKPYFPGYILTKADLEITGLNTFQYMPHANGLVCFGGEPGIIPEAVIDNLRRYLAELRESDQEPIGQFRWGDQVRIHVGPLEGYQAIFDHRLPGKHRVKVLLELIGGRQVPLELSSLDIAAA